MKRPDYGNNRPGATSATCWLKKEKKKGGGHRELPDKPKPQWAYICSGTDGQRTGAPYTRGRREKSNGAEDSEGTQKRAIETISSAKQPPCRLALRESGWERERVETNIFLFPRHLSKENAAHYEIVVENLDRSGSKLERRWGALRRLKRIFAGGGYSPRPEVSFAEDVPRCANEKS